MLSSGMKLSEYAKRVGVSYRTAWRWWKEGKLSGYQMDTGTVIITVPDNGPVATASVAIYARVSATENRPHLDTQVERLANYCTARGYQVQQVVKEIGSGVNDSRPKFLKLLADPTIGVIVVEHKDRATRFGFRYLETLLVAQGRRIEVVNLAQNSQDDLVADLVAIVYSFAARLYGQRRAKRTTDRIKAVLESEEQDATGGTTPH